MGTPRPTQAPGYAWYGVFVLVLAYTLSFIDRTILSLMVDPIRASLGISDVQLSLLHGFAFALFYTALGLPVGRLVDRRRRTGIIAGGIMLWSTATALCGLARSFGSMFTARVGVGVGEATLSPAAYSLLADWFPPDQRTRALSLYTAAMYMGGGLALVAGGALIAMVPPMRLPVLGPLEPWQLVFLIVAAPGLPVALLVAGLREPARTGAASAEPAPGLAAVRAHARRHLAAYLLLIGGFSVSALMWNGVQAWLPSVLIRAHGWSASEAGRGFGLVVLVFGTGGIVFGGWLGGRLRARGRLDANLRLGVVSALAALPFAAVAPLAPSGTLVLALYAPFTFAAALPYGGAAAAIQDITPSRMRGQFSALFLLGLNLMGIGLGPTAVAGVAVLLPGGLGTALALTASSAAICSALLLWRGRRPYLAAMAQAG
jgi:MFS family permease